MVNSFLSKSDRQPIFLSTMPIHYKVGQGREYRNLSAIGHWHDKPSNEWATQRPYQCAALARMEEFEVNAFNGVGLNQLLSTSYQCIKT